MNNIAFFSYLVIGVGVSSWGFSSFSKDSNSLPYVGALLNFDSKEFEQIKDIPTVINATDIEYAYKNLPCANTTFPDVSSWDESFSKDIEVTVGNSNEISGCLSIWWNQEETTEEGVPTRSGNILWSMSDGNQGTLFLSKVTVTNGVTRKVNENLYLMGKRQGSESWEILMNMTKDQELEIPLDEFEEQTETTDGWLTLPSDSHSGRKDWSFIIEESGVHNRSPETWIQEITKWTGDSEILNTATQYYEKFEGYFKPEA